VQDLDTDEELASVAAVSAGNNTEIGDMISRAMQRVGRQGVVTMEESRTAEDSLYVVEGMQFERGYISPYFVTDPERMIAEYETCNLLLVDKKISSAREIVGLLEMSIRSGNPLMIMAEDFEQVSVLWVHCLLERKPERKLAAAKRGALTRETWQRLPCLQA
jgi:chaperonin GroEL